MAEFLDAPDVEAVAQQLIPKYHHHLLNASIRYLFRKGSPLTHGGRPVAGTAKVIKGETAYLTGLNFRIMIDGDLWPKLPPDIQEALVDHELKHCGGELVDGQWRWFIVHHDVEDFADIVQRHGFWTAELKQLNDAARHYYQMNLLGQLASPPTGAPAGQVAGVPA